MTYRNHVTSVNQVAVQHGSMPEIADALDMELDAGDENHSAIVLNDMGNLEAMVIKGTPEQHMQLAFAIATNALGPDSELRGAIEEILGDAYAYRLGSADPHDLDLEPTDREAMERFEKLAERLGLTIPD